jgi:hypothetical protein
VGETSPEAVNGPQADVAGYPARTHHRHDDDQEHGMTDTSTTPADRLVRLALAPVRLDVMCGSLAAWSPFLGRLVGPTGA